MKPVRFDSIMGTKRTGGTKYTTVSLPRDLNLEADRICATLHCSKLKFVTMAMERLIAEFHLQYKEENND